MLPSDAIGPSRLPSTLPSVDLAPATLTPPQQQALAQRYAPILYFHPDEQHFLQDPNTYIQQSSLRQELDWRPDRELHGRGEVPPEELAGIGKGNKDADSQIFLDHGNEDLGDGVRNGDLGNSKNLYQYDAETNTITYHLFYAYNDGPPGLGDVQNHEGDWEKITVQLDSQMQPTEVRYSAHNGLQVARSWADAPKEDGRPVSYVGQGSHANYPETGRWATNFPGVDDQARAGGRRFDLSEQPLTDVTEQAWYGGHVLWGERGSASEVGIGETSGPTGPSPDKGPITQADRSLQPQEVEVPGLLPFGPFGPLIPNFPR
ncbi:Vps62-related protein [Lysobacter sp. CA199]|uniref:Vps62-related protein n=1 Tax=Lysobacter sp. CA199 TaxID=3455608 RepID=UPI003F8D3386